MHFCLANYYQYFCRFYSNRCATDLIFGWLSESSAICDALRPHRSSLRALRTLLFKQHTLKGLSHSILHLSSEDMMALISAIADLLFSENGLLYFPPSVLFGIAGLGALLTVCVALLPSALSDWQRRFMMELNNIGFRRQAPMEWVSPFSPCPCRPTDHENLTLVSPDCADENGYGTPDLIFSLLPNMIISRCVLTHGVIGQPPDLGTPIFFTPVIEQKDLLVSNSFRENPEDEWGVLQSEVVNLSSVDRGLLYISTLRGVRPYGFLLPLTAMNVTDPLVPTEAWVVKDQTTSNPSAWMTVALLNAYQLRTCRGDLSVTNTRGVARVEATSALPSVRGPSRGVQAFGSPPLHRIPTYRDRSVAGTRICDADGPCTFSVSPSLHYDACHSKSDAIHTFCETKSPGKRHLAVLMTALSRTSCEVCSCSGDTCPVWCSPTLRCRTTLENNMILMNYSQDNVRLDLYCLDTQLLQGGGGVSSTSVRRLRISQAHGYLMKLCHSKTYFHSEGPPHPFQIVRDINLEVDDVQTRHLVLPSLMCRFFVEADGREVVLSRSGLVFVMKDVDTDLKLTPARFGSVYPLPQVAVHRDIDLVKYGPGLQFGQAVSESAQQEMWRPFREMYDDDVLRRDLVNGRVIPITMTILPSWIEYVVSGDESFRRSEVANGELVLLREKLYKGMSSHWVFVKLGEDDQAGHFQVSQAPHFAIVSGPALKLHRGHPPLQVRYPYDDQVSVPFHQPTMSLRPYSRVPSQVRSKLALHLRRGGLIFKCSCTDLLPVNFIDVTVDGDDTIPGKIRSWHEEQGITNCQHYKWLGSFKADTFGSLNLSDVPGEESLRQLAQTFRLFIDPPGPFALDLRQRMHRFWMDLPPLDTKVDNVIQSVSYSTTRQNRTSPAFQKVTQDSRTCSTKLFIPITNGGANRIMDLEDLTVHIGPLLTQSLWYLMLSGSVMNTFINERSFSGRVRTAIVCVFGRVLTISASTVDQYDALLNFMFDFSRGVGVAGLDYMASHTNAQITLLTQRDNANGCDLRSEYPSAVLFPFGREEAEDFISSLAACATSDRWRGESGEAAVNDLIRFWGHASFAIPSFRGMLGNSCFSMFFDSSQKAFTSSAGGDVLAGGTAIFGPVY